MENENDERKEIRTDRETGLATGKQEENNNKGRKGGRGKELER